MKVTKSHPDGVWAKLKHDPLSGRCTAWHPLIAHAADVAACAEMLLRQPTWSARLARLALVPELDDVTVSRLCVFAALHDLGKCNRGFQGRGRPDLRAARAGHVGEAVAAAVGGRLVGLAPIVDAWGDAASGLLLAAFCHHGRPISPHVAGPSAKSLWHADKLLDPLAEVTRLFDAAIRWFPQSLTAGPPLPTATGFGHAFAGLVMLADWIGSDEAVFPFAENDAADERMSFARERAARFAADAWLSLSPSRRADGSDRAPFVRVTGGILHPRPAQAVLSELPDMSDGSLTILEAETGSGKTEAALAHFVRLYADGAVDGLYFALPTRTAATEIHARVVAGLRAAFAEPPPVALAVPGYLRTDDHDGVRPLCGFEVLWNDDPTEADRHRRWASESAKRYLAACVAVGTIDQLLLSQLRVTHAHLRASSALRQLLVVDEVHASDGYMVRVLEQVLKRHLSAGGHALLLSATLAGESRVRLLGAALGRRLDDPSRDEALRTAYPLVSGVERFGDPRAWAVTSEEHREVVVEVQPILEDPASIAEIALGAAGRGAKVLVLRNTVADCVATQQAMELMADAMGLTPLLFRCAEVTAPHHSRYARPDRRLLDRALQARLGREREEGGCVVVATQTVQQSLDVDADLLLTDLCPVDVLLQRIGRLHRHTRIRPDGFDEARCHVLVPGERDLGVLLKKDGSARHHHGLGSVYDDLRMLEACWRLVEERPRWSLPADCRVLVELGLHSSVLKNLVDEFGGAWVAHSMHLDGDRFGKRRLAELNLVDWTVPYAELTFETGDRVATRLGESDRRVRLPSAVVGPFGESVEELALPARWVRGTDPTLEIAAGVSTSNGAMYFRFGEYQFRYDRLGLSKTTDDGDPPLSQTYVEVD